MVPSAPAVVIWSAERPFSFRFCDNLAVENGYCRRNAEGHRRSYAGRRHVDRRWRIIAGAGMKSIYLDLTSILNHALERASENLSFNRLLVQIGIDPSNITFDAVVQRLLDIVVANI